MNRRGFLGLLATGVVGACVATKLQTDWLPRGVRSRAALEFLRRAYNEWTAAHSTGDWRRNGPGLVVPRRMTAGRELFEAARGEMRVHERFVAYEDAKDGRENLKFKGATLYPEGTGWRVECHAV